MKAVTYLRVSTGEQTLEPQRLELRQFAALRGLELGEEFVDVMSGAKRDRTGLDALMAAVRAGSVKTILCVKLDRVARSLSHLAALVDEFDRRKVALICTSQGIDTSEGNACGRLQFQVLGAVAEFERSLIRERTRAGLAAARARGAVLGRPSPKMAGVDRAAACAAWEADGRKGGYRELGRRLGGVGGMTAWRVWKQWEATRTADLA